jgi:putative hemolysin
MPERVNMGIVVLLVVVACVLCQAFLAASEVALVAADDLKVHAEHQGGDPQALVLGKLLQRRDRVVAMLLTGTNLVTVIAAAALSSFLHGLNPHASYLAPFILAPVTLLLGETIPKLAILKAPLQFARFAARPLSVLSTVLAPLLTAETALSRYLRRLAGVAPDTETVFLSREDLALLVRRQPPAAPSEIVDAIMPEEQQMISRIFRFTRAEARKAMVPLVNVQAVPEETTIAGAIEVVRREGFTRIPVFHERIFDIVGVVHAFDLLEAPDLASEVREVMRPVSYFSESTPLDEVLIALQRTGETLAVVVDEYGGASGIITIEDLLEEVVGEIEDEHDVREELARVTGPRTLVVSGHAAVADLNERFGLGLPEADEYTTIGGLIVERLGHIPKAGEQLRAGSATLIVTRSDARAVREVVLNLDHPLNPDLQPCQ